MSSQAPGAGGRRLPRRPRHRVSGVLLLAGARRGALPAAASALPPTARQSLITLSQDDAGDWYAAVSSHWPHCGLCQRPYSMPCRVCFRSLVSMTTEVSVLRCAGVSMGLLRRHRQPADPEPVSHAVELSSSDKEDSDSGKRTPAARLGSRRRPCTTIRRPCRALRRTGGAR